MAGARKAVQVDNSLTQKALTEALQQAADLTPVMRSIGESLKLSTDERFRQQKDPFGKSWEKLSAITVEKRGSATPILTDTGVLNSSINYHPSSDDVEIGTNRIYAAMMQFGGTSGTGAEIPARPFLGFSDDDREEILRMLSDFVQNAME